MPFIRVLTPHLITQVSSSASRQRTLVQVRTRLRQYALVDKAGFCTGTEGTVIGLAGRISSDPYFKDALGAQALAALMSDADYTGTAPRRARELAARIRNTCGTHTGQGSQ